MTRPVRPRRPRSPFAPHLRHLVEEAGAGATGLFAGDGLRSVRGLEALTSLESLTLPSGVKLGPVARLPHLRQLTLLGPHREASLRSRSVDLRPLAGAPALDELLLHGVHVRELSPLAEVSTLRSVELGFLQAPSLRPLAGLPLTRFVLDGVSGVRLNQLRGLSVSALDVWGCVGAVDPSALDTMPNLREVWFHGDAPDVLDHLRHVADGATLVVDGSVDPDRHRDTIRALEGRGVWLFVGHEPHENGVHPSWWGDCAGLADPARATPPRYVSPPR